MGKGMTKDESHERYLIGKQLEHEGLGGEEIAKRLKFASKHGWITAKAYYEKTAVHPEPEVMQLPIEQLCNTAESSVEESDQGYDLIRQGATAMTINEPLQESKSSTLRIPVIHGEMCEYDLTEVGKMKIKDNHGFYIVIGTKHLGSLVDELHEVLEITNRMKTGAAV